MTTPFHVTLRPVASLLVLGMGLPLCGCGSADPEFRLNEVYVLKQEKIIKEEFTSLAKDDLTNVIVALFGTPDDPQAPAMEGVDLSSMLEPSKLRMAAGRVGSDETGSRGLYRKHCVHCHGIDGDGTGPTASFLNPYPRDYRMGVFKFKSTIKGERPTHADLKRILVNGIENTAMPSFRLLDSDQLESLLQYVIYLSMRGEVERKLIELSSEYDYLATEPERLVDVSNREADPDEFNFQLEAIREVVSSVAQKWQRAEQFAVEAQRPKQWKSDPASIDRGRELFFGIGGCAKCHGDSALGDGQVTDFDDWTKEIEPADPEAVRRYVALGAMKPRNIRPRNLRMNVYRGGRRPIDIYWRIRNGIDGTPMPAAPMKPDGAPADYKGLSEDDLWHLVDYVLALPNEPLSQPATSQPNIHRERL